jgi:hypothetical protein
MDDIISGEFSKHDDWIGITMNVNLRAATAKLISKKR